MGAPRPLGQSRSDRREAFFKPTGHLIDVLASHGERWSKSGEFRAASQQQSPGPSGLLEKLAGTDMALEALLSQSITHEFEPLQKPYPPHLADNGEALRQLVQALAQSLSLQTDVAEDIPRRNSFRTARPAAQAIGLPP